MDMKIASILCLTSMALLVSSNPQAGSIPAMVECYGGRMCGSECNVLPFPFMGMCSCSGPCTNLEIASLMKDGHSRTEAEKKMTKATRVSFKIKEIKISIDSI